jgi:hypothetical protein
MASRETTAPIVMKTDGQAGMEDPARRDVPGILAIAESMASPAARVVREKVAAFM